MMFLLRKLLNFIIPPRCLLCHRPIESNGALCPDCFDKVNFITLPYCMHCGAPLEGRNDDIKGLCCGTCLTKKDIFRLRRAAILYEDVSKKILLDFKFADHTENKYLLAQWLYFAGKDIFNAGVDVIIPVPLHYTRLFKRKYNQSALLAHELSKLSNLPVDYSSLKRTKKTLPQSLCNGSKRKSNVRDAFDVIHQQNVKGKRIVLVDDVYTTGATLRECAKVLKKAGAKSIDALTVARA